MVKCQKIPKTEITILASGLVGVIAEYFEDEDHMREFEEWKRRRNEQMGVCEPGGVVAGAAAD